MKRNKKYITSPRHETNARKNTDLVSVVLLSENHGYRMKSYGPIPLIRVGDKNLLERQVESIQATFLNFEIILCSGFETEKIVNFIKDRYSDVNIRVVENQVHYNSNCCESTRLCINNTTNNKILLCGGSVLIDPPHLEMINLNESSVMTQDENADSSFEIGVIFNDNNRLENLSLGVRSNYWTELIYLSNNKIIKAIHSIISHPEYKNRFVFEAINELSNKHDIRVVSNFQTPLRKIDNIKTLKRIQ
jgi:choline kinase